MLLNLMKAINDSYTTASFPPKILEEDQDFYFYHFYSSLWDARVEQ